MFLFPGFMSPQQQIFCNVDGGVELQIWRLAENILNKKLTGVVLRLGDWHEANKLTLQKKFTEKLRRGTQKLVVKKNGHDN